MESNLKANFDLFNNKEYISKKDVLILLELLGFNIQDNILKKIIKKKNKITYDKFLSIIFEYRSINNNHYKIIKAFDSLTNNNEKLIDIDYLTNLLTTKGDILSFNDIKNFYSFIEIDDNKFKYLDFIQLINNF